MTYGNKPYKLSVALKSNFPYDGVADFENRREGNPDRFLFLQGNPLALVCPKLHFEVGWKAEPGLELDFWPNNSGSLLAGPQAQRFLEEFCPEDVQFFPACLHCKDQDISIYCLVNLSQRVHALDVTRSQCDYFDSGRLAGVNRYYFHENCMGGHHIARDSKLHSWEVCSPEFVKEYKRRKLKGLKFFEDYSGKGDGLYRV